MIERFAIALNILVAVPAAAETAAPPPVAAPAEDLVRVALETEKGRIVLALDRGRAPVTTANFLR
jgi:peptidyl-prolyl cis-trans isomerase A (cyclophilin A)